MTKINIKEADRNKGTVQTAGYKFVKEDGKTKFLVTYKYFSESRTYVYFYDVSDLSNVIPIRKR